MQTGPVSIIIDEMKKSNSPILDFRQADRVGIPVMMWNKLRTIRIYNSRKSFRRLREPDEFFAAIQGYEERGSGNNSGEKKAASLWKLEGLIREAKISGIDGTLLKEPSLERLKPILHVGWGMHIIGDTGFDFSRWETALQASADTRYRRMTMEPIGLVYAGSRQRLKARFAGISLPPVDEPENISRFFSRFNDMDIRMISHGYGRGTYFQNVTLRSALRAAVECPEFLDPLYAVRGVAFAHTLVNISCLDRIFETNGTKDFHTGIATALALLEWHFPGLLENLPDNACVGETRQILVHHKTRGNIYHF